MSIETLLLLSNNIFYLNSFSILKIGLIIDSFLFLWRLIVQQLSQSGVLEDVTIGVVTKTSTSAIKVTPLLNDSFVTNLTVCFAVGINFGSCVWKVVKADNWTNWFFYENTFKNKFKLNQNWKILDYFHWQKWNLWQ